MNQKEWKKLCTRPRSELPKNMFYYRNLAEKLLGYKRNSGMVIHHLRDTEEQRKFNDTYYERWGIDFDDKIKYVKLMTKEEHIKVHKISLETRQKISKSVSLAKKRYTQKELDEHKRISDNLYKAEHKEEIKELKHIYYEKNKEKIKARTKEYRENNKEKIKESKRQWKNKNREYVNRKKREYYARKKGM